MTTGRVPPCAARRFSPLFAVICAATALASAAPAAADDDGAETTPPAYRTDNTDWDGLSTFAELVQGMGLELRITADIDWADLDGNDILAVVYPTVRLDPSHLAAFLRGGGFALVADDFGSADDALARLGMLRGPAIGVDAPRYHDNRAFAPVALPRRSDHALSDGVEELVTNHPSVFAQVTGPEVVFGFGTNEALVCAGALGTGRIIAVADPSIFINRMLEFDGNAQFTLNTLRYLAREGRARRVVLLTGEFILYGQPKALVDESTVGGKAAALAADINAWLDERNDYLLTATGLQSVSVGAAIILCLIGLLAWPRRRGALADGAWTRAPNRDSADDPATILAAFDGRRTGENYLLLATVVRDTVNAALSRALDHPDPLFAMSERDLLARVETGYGAPARQRLAAIHPRLRPLPSRAQAASSFRKGRMGRREFLRLSHDATELYRTLGDQEVNP